MFPDEHHKAASLYPHGRAQQLSGRSEDVRQAFLLTNCGHVAHDVNWGHISGKDDQTLFTLPDAGLNVLEAVPDEFLMLAPFLDALEQLQRNNHVGKKIKIT